MKWPQSHPAAKVGCWPFAAAGSGSRAACSGSSPAPRAGGPWGGRGSGCAPKGHPHPAALDRTAAVPGTAPALSRWQLGHNFPGTPAAPSAPGFKLREVEPLSAPIPPPPDTPPPALASAQPSRPVPDPSGPSGLAMPGNGEFPRDPYLGHGEQRLHRDAAGCAAAGGGSTTLRSCVEQRHPGCWPWVRHCLTRFHQGRSEPSPVRSCPAQGKMCFFRT